MSPLPPPNARLTPEPGEKRAYPWRFRVNDRVYLLSHPFEQTFTVIGGELWMGFPHLKVLDLDGKCWRVPQIHASSKPITFRKG
jgi:hypothetical protein